MFKITNDELLATRGKAPELVRGDRVQISSRCGDWYEDNLGTVERVAGTADDKGRVFVDVLMDGMPQLNGKKGQPPLPRFEAGLVRKAS